MTPQREFIMHNVVMIAVATTILGYGFMVVSTMVAELRRWIRYLTCSIGLALTSAAIIVPYSLYGLDYPVTLGRMWQHNAPFGWVSMMACVGALLGSFGWAMAMLYIAKVEPEDERNWDQLLSETH